MTMSGTVLGCFGLLDSFWAHDRKKHLGETDGNGDDDEGEVKDDLHRL